MTFFANETVTLSMIVPETIHTFGGEWDGKKQRIALHPAELSPEMLGKIWYEGALRVLRDGTGGKDREDSDKAASVLKRQDAWKAGAWTMGGGGKRSDTLAREAFRLELESKAGKLTDKAWAELQRSIVAKAGGDPGKGAVAFDAFIAAFAKVKYPKEAEAKAGELLARFEAAGDALAAERAKATASLSIDDIEI